MKIFCFKKAAKAIAFVAVSSTYLSQAALAQYTLLDCVIALEAAAETRDYQSDPAYEAADMAKSAAMAQADLRDEYLEDVDDIYDTQYPLLSSFDQDAVDTYLGAAGVEESNGDTDYGSGASDYATGITLRSQASILYAAAENYTSFDQCVSDAYSASSKWLESKDYLTGATGITGAETHFDNAEAHYASSASDTFTALAILQNANPDP